MTRRKGITVLLVLAVAALPAAVALAKKAPVNLSGSVWHLTAKVQQKLQKVGGFKDVTQVWLYFGPNAGEMLDPDEFAIFGEEGPGLYGTWSDPKANGSPVLDFDQPDLQDMLVDNVTEGLEEVFMDVSDVQVQLTKVQAKCKCKPGKGASFSLKVGYVGTAHVDGEDVAGKGSFAVKGKGPQQMPK